MNLSASKQFGDLKRRFWCWLHDRFIQSPARQRIGTRGEEIAARYLRRRGWRILERNVRLGRGELDIIAQEGEELVIVEVRTVREGFIEPAESVRKEKLRSLERLSQLYLRKKGWEGRYRIDLITIVLDTAGKSPQKITHLPYLSTSL